MNLRVTKDKTMTFNMIKLKLQTVALYTLFLMFYIPNANAGSVIADTPCDSLYYESLSARAWLEAQREITQNQNIILKPDSVFEYTCFDRLVRELAVQGTNMLSETSAFGRPLGPSSLDNALQRLVGVSLITYINNNFGSKSSASGYNLLSGHPAAAGINHVPESITGGSAYSCDIMMRVWEKAKCINFISNGNTDGFFTFSEYASSITDKRVLPTMCTSIQTNWNANLASALTSGPWTNDPVQTYFNLTTPVNCSGTNCPCSGQPIPTGVQVVRSGYNTNTYQEHVCLQPGCRYHPGGDPLYPGGGVVSAAGCYGR